ncbi:MAG: recombination mediator RecR [Candidatus Yanofskybacteria bacterium]|nr:recombination mediator RecR [Candidatus Yanofskybacteria bacterium]
MNPKFKYLVKLFQKLPGVGPRQGARFVLALLNRSDAELQEFGTAIASMKQAIRFCRECFNVADTDICAICSNSKRDRTKILVVEKITDLDSFEKTGLYRGLYHVLGGAINPVENMTPEYLKLNELSRRVSALAKDNPNIELIIATNPSTEGETTSLYIKDMFRNKKEVTLTRLARGLASGSNLEYADEITLKNALDYRK